MNFNLSELEKLHQGVGESGEKKRRVLPSILAKAKPKVGVGKVAASGSSRGEERVVEGGERHDAGRAVQEPEVKEVAEVVPRTRRRAAAAKAAVAGDSEEGVIMDKGVLKEGTSVAVVDASSSEKLPAPAASKTKKTVKKSTKKNDGAVQYEDGLGALHEAMRLSGGIHFDDDPTAVIKAEALEDRKVRMMAQSQTKRKRGRPRKTDTVSAVGRKRVTRAHVCDTQDDEGDTQEASASMGETDGGKRKSSRKSVLSKALVKLEDAPAAGGENSNGEEDGKAVPKKPVINNLADKTLDAENWTLKDIVKWGNARERKLAKEQAKTQQKTYVRPPVQPVQETEPPLLHPKVHVKDGKIVVDQTSLTVAAQQKEEYTKIVTEDSHSINSMSYVNRLSNDRWSIEDTELFFRALSQFGTDFTLIAQLFPGRQRKHLKKKFCKEGKVNAARVDAAMRASAHATINSYKEMIVLLKNSGMKVQRTYNTST